MWLNQDWAALPTPHVATYNIDSESHSISVATDDGSPIGCRKSASVFDFKILPKQLPALEVSFEIHMTLGDPPPYNYFAEYFLGQTFSQFEFFPDGQSHTFTAYLDRAYRYNATYVMAGISGEELAGGSAIDASIPTPLAVPGGQLYLYAQQADNHFIASYAGLGNFVVSLGTPQAGDWGRWATTQAGTDVRTLTSSIWLKQGSPTTVGGNTLIFVAGNPDWSDGADPIYFGWAWRSVFSQQILPVGLPGGDIRFTRSIQTIRLDRFCMTIT